MGLGLGGRREAGFLWGRVSQHPFQPNLGYFLWRKERCRVPPGVEVKPRMSRKPGFCSSLEDAPLGSLPDCSAGNLCSAPGETPSAQTPVVQRSRHGDLTGDAGKQARPKPSGWAAPLVPEASGHRDALCCAHPGPHVIQQALPGSHTGRC